MSVLESLYILVKLETEGLKKSLDETQSQVKKLENEFGNLGRAGDHVSESFNTVLHSLTGMFAGFASFHSILSGASGAVAGIRELGNVSRELNVDVSALDAWGAAVTRIGGTAQGFQGSLRSLAEHFGTTNEIALRALPRLADSFSRLNSRQAQFYGKSLGLDQSTILLLQQGRREVEATVNQQRQLGVVTKEQAEITRKFDAALFDVRRTYEQFYREFTAPILPYFTEALKWTIDHKDFVKDAFVTMGAGVGVLALALIRLNAPLAIAVGAITTLSALSAGIEDDLKAYREGRHSVTGDYLGGVPDKVDKGFTFSWPAIKASLANISSFGSPFFPTGGPAIGGGNSGGPTTVTVGDININTQATDAEGIALHASESFKKHIGQAISQVDNGVAK